MFTGEPNEPLTCDLYVYDYEDGTVLFSNFLGMNLLMPVFDEEGNLVIEVNMDPTFGPTVYDYTSEDHNVVLTKTENGYEYVAEMMAQIYSFAISRITMTLDTTAINGVAASTVKSNNAPIFNLAGQRMQKMQKGINIVNGKKVVK